MRETMIGAYRAVNNRRGDQRTLDVTLMMLLLAFFIVLTSLSVPSDSNRKSALGSLTGAMGILPGGLSPFMGEGRGLTLKPGVILSERMNMAALLSKFEDNVRTDKRGAYIRTVLTKGGLEIMVENKILFTPGSATLSADSQKVMQQISYLLKRVKGDIRIESHTGSKKMTSARFGDNRGLSVARAGTIVRFLISQGDIKRRRLSLSGYGALRPMATTQETTDTEANDRTRFLFKYIST